MTVDAEGNEFTCESGRAADFGGRWLLPCFIPFSKNQHTLITVAGTWVFCDTHMEELIASGLITDPYISEEGAQQLVKMERNELMRNRPLFGPWEQP